MSLCWNQFEKTETVTQYEEEKLFDKVFTECSKKNIINKGKKNMTKKQICLKYLDYYHMTKNIDNLKIIFDILDNYNFNLESEIYYAINTLAYLKNVKHNKKMIQRLLSSPIIDDISFNDGIFNVSSQKCGDYSFGVASYFLKDNKDINNYITTNKKELEMCCHDNTEFLTKQYPNLYAVITKSLSFFANYRYYHSYAYDDTNDIVIDLCLNAIMNREDYERLQHPIIVSQIQNKDIDTEFANIEKSFYNLSEINTRLLIIALHKEYIASKLNNSNQKVLTKVNN